MRRKLLYLGAGTGVLVMTMVLWAAFRKPALAQSGAVSVATAFSCYPQGPLACTKIQTVVAAPAGIVSTCYSPTSLGGGSFRSRIVTNITSISQANPAVITAAGHGFTLATLPIVTISGVTGTGWPAINNTWVATIINSSTFSVPFNSGALAAPTTTGSYTTTAPRFNVAEWAVQVFVNDATTHLPTGSFWQGNAIAGTNLPGGPTAAFANKCSDIGGATIPLQ